jgi:protein-arginine kinase activator protein McsA
MSENICNRCGKDMPVRPTLTSFELGFRKEEVLLCENCAKETKDNEKKYKDKYKKEMIELLNKYFNKVLQ